MNNKVLHITDEYSQKNYSIVSLIIFLSDYFKDNYSINSSFLVLNLDFD